MWPLAVVIAMTIVALATRGTRWASLSLLASRCAYGVYVIHGLLYFPAQAGFRMTPLTCEWKFGLALAMHSLTNYRHIILFVLFFLLTYAQLPNVPRAFVWAMAACIAMGFLVELDQGVTGVGHCRMRDLIPDTAGALIGASLVITGRLVRNRLR
jgi:glycopeptide antibiotics resistance protein